MTGFIRRLWIIRGNKFCISVYSSAIFNHPNMSRLVQITNARLTIGNQLVSRSLWFDREAGVFVPPPDPASAASAIDLQGRIVAPGFLDLQINGAYGFDFSEDSSVDADGLSWADRYREVRQKLITTGTTSFLPTMTSQLPDRYHEVSMSHANPYDIASSMSQ